MNIYDTYFMLATVEELPLQRTFFKDRYFPTNISLDVFGTSRVFVDFREGNKKLAPFVVPRIGGVSIMREGFETFEIEPPNIELSRPLTIDDLQSRGFGESLLSDKTPADREALFLAEDLKELSDRVTRREEWMSVETILGNGCVMRHITDRADVQKDIEARYYTGSNNPALYTPATPWASGVDWRSDVKAMVKKLRSRGLPVTDLVVAPDVGEFIENDPWFEKRLDIKRMEYGNLKPQELPDGTTLLGVLNFGGTELNILIHDDSYENDAGTEVPFLPLGTVIAIAPACGHTIYGGVTQMEDDEKLHTTAGMRVPKHIADKKSDTQEVKITSKPLMAPTRKAPWMVAKNVFN